MAASDRTPDEPFWHVLATSFARPCEDLWQRLDSPLADLGVDELMLFRLMLDLRALNSNFDFPDQVAILDVTVRDLWHYFTVMTEAHRERD